MASIKKNKDDIRTNYIKATLGIFFNLQKC